MYQLCEKTPDFEKVNDESQSRNQTKLSLNYNKTARIRAKP